MTSSSTTTTSALPPAQQYSSNGRTRGHAHSLSSDNMRPRSASSAGSSASTSRSVDSAPVKIGSSSSGTTPQQAHAGLSDEQRLSVLRMQQAQKRPRMLRLTPAVSASRSLSAAMAPLASSSTKREGESSRPASIIGLPSIGGQYASSSSTSSGSSSATVSDSESVHAAPNAGLTIAIHPRTNALYAQAEADDKVAFPVVGSPPNAHAIPLHPGSRKALAQKLGLQPADGVLLQLDLGCISGPSMSQQSSSGSVNSAMTLPDLVRKKSGEPVKSSLKHFSQSAFLHRADSSPAAPASFRAKSVPNTPTVAKAVHFDPILEHIKVFKYRQRPTAVSRDGSPEHTETETEEEKEFPFYGNWRKHAAAVAAGSSPGGGSSASPGSGASTPILEAAGGGGAAEQLVLRLPNFPSSAKLSVERNVFLERVFLSDDLRSVKGTVQVRNMAFEKWVAVRFTLDNWATACEVSAEYTESIKGGKSDRFTFSIKLNEMLLWTRGQQETKTMLLCLRYNAAGEEFWDNNEGENYQLDFRKRPIAQAEGAGTRQGSSAAAASGSGSGSRSSSRGPETASPNMARAATVGSSVSRKANSPGLAGAEFGSTSSSSTSSLSRRSAKLLFEAEELDRTLTKLRADDDEAEAALRSIKTRRRSPPSSPGSANGGPNGASGHGRSSSPSMWQSRYDFDQSLRDPKSGSRTTNAGRQAALDYFSAKPPAPASALQRSVFIGSSSTGSPTLHVEGDVFSPADSVGSVGSDTPVPTRRSSTTPVAVQLKSTSTMMKDGMGATLPVPMGVFTAKAGMISPGLGDVIAHLPTSISTNSATSSPSTVAGSPGSDATISPGANADDAEGSSRPVVRQGQRQDSGTAIMFTPVGLRGGSVDSGRAQSMHTKYFSYPVNRSTLSPAAGSLHRFSGGSEERAPSPLSRPVLVMDEASLVVSDRSSPTKKDRSNRGELLLSSIFVTDSSSPQHSPVSPLSSPNPFSPSLSVSSLESDNTTCLASPEDTVLTSGVSGNSANRRSVGELRAPASIEDIHRSLLSMARSENSGPSTPEMSLPSSFGATSTNGSLMTMITSSSSGGGPGSNSSHSQPGSGSPTLSAISDSSSSSSMKPNSVSSYDELIARFCFYDSSAESTSAVAAAASSSANLNGGGSHIALVPSIVGGADVGDDTLLAPIIGTASLNGPVHSGLQRDVHVPHMSHLGFANSMGSPSTESGSTTPTIGF